MIEKLCLCLGRQDEAEDGDAEEEDAEDGSCEGQTQRKLRRSKREVVAVGDEEVNHLGCCMSYFLLVLLLYRPAVPVNLLREVGQRLDPA